MNEEEINLLDYVKVIRKWREFIISFTAGAVILTVLMCLLMPWTYKAETTILIPQQSLHGMEGLLAMSSMMTGSMINLPSELSQSFLGRTSNFSDILRSKTVAEMIVDGLDLKKYYKTNNKDALIASIRRKITVKEQRGILSISVLDRDPKLASDIANYSVIALDEFNKKGNIQLAKRMNVFIREQLATAKIDLSEAEEKLKKFETQSQMVKMSERELMLARLLRDVKVKEAIYTILLQESEKSKIDEAKVELFFEVLDTARPPKRPFKPKPFLYSLVALVLGTFTSGFLAFFFEYLESLGIKIPAMDYGKEIKWKEMKQFLMTWRQ